MARLPKYTLTYIEKKESWNLVNDKTNRTKASFGSKDDATAGGVLAKVLGKDGGSVKIQKMNGKIQEERTFPREADPSSSPG
jgi:Uncharacterized protein conserved in bacteria (DUF2188)